MLAAFSDAATLRHALAFEAELARAEAAEGLIGTEAAEAIAALCASITIDPAELAEERRLAYVGITRARKKLYLSRSVVRTMFGQPAYNPASRFFAEIPDDLIDWRRKESEVASWASGAAERTASARAALGSGTIFGTGRGQAIKKTLPTVNTGDRVLHSTYGMGTVVATHGSGDNAKADVDFGSSGVKRFALKYAPLEKL